MPNYTLDQMRKMEDIEQKLVSFRREYPTAYKSKQKTILLMVRSLKNAWLKITGQEYQKPQLKPSDTATTVSGKPV